MRAVVLEETRKIAVREVPDAEMRETTDVLLRITSTAICGTDLHFYEGRMPGLEGQVIGHEPLGLVEEAGSAVKNVKKGDRVVVPTHICCGFCAMCADGHTSACLITNPGQAGAAYGYPNKGGYQGAQTELLRVPFANANCLKLPGEPGDAWENDFVSLSDAFPTGYHATGILEIAPADTVVVFGAGSVGLLAAYSARLRGAPAFIPWTPSRNASRRPANSVPSPSIFFKAIPWSKSRSSNRDGAQARRSSKRPRCPESRALSMQSDSRPVRKWITTVRIRFGSPKPLRS